MEILQASLVILFAFGALLALLFVALVAGVASADRARIGAAARRSTHPPL